MRIGILTSGGDCPGINATIRGVCKTAINYYGMEVVGIHSGFQGLLTKDVESITDKSLSGLLNLGGTMLGTSREKPFKKGGVVSDVDKPSLILQNIHEIGLDCVVCIGGNGTQKTAAKFVAMGVNIVSVPKTIDNDLMCTDHTPGFGSAAKYVAATVQEIARDSSVYSVKSVTVVEIMGRDAGWLTASTCVLKANDENAPHLIYLPETPFSVERFLEDVKRMLVEHNAVVVAVSEGLKLSDGEYAAEEFQSGHDDAFGHKYLSGIGKCLENIVRKEIGCKVRSIELNVMQRCASHMASKTDVDESVKIGEEAVKAAVKGETGKMMAFKRISDRPYFSEIVTVDAKEVANKERLFPKEWINNQGNNVTAFALDYFLPLIQGEVNVLMENGMPVHLKIPNWF